MSDEAAPHRSIDPKELRVSDAERDHVVGVLRKAIGQGLLSLDEFDTRADRAAHARTRAELNAVLIDLPGLVNRSTAADRGVEAGRPHPAPAALDATPAPSGQRVELTASLSSIVRSGRWSVPRELVVYSRLGRVVLDLTEARIDHQVVSIELDVAVGKVHLVVPAAATVAVDGLELVLSGVRNRAGQDAAATGVPHIVLTGSVRMGSVAIRRHRHSRPRGLARRALFRRRGRTR